MTLISESAAVQRLRRVLRSKNLVLKTARYGSQIYSYMGRHSVWDLYRNLPVDTHCDIEELVRNFGVLGPYEEIWTSPGAPEQSERWKNAAEEPGNERPANA